MKLYKVYFEIFGKKMKTEIIGRNKEDAENNVKLMLKFHKTEEVAIDPRTAELADEFYNNLCKAFKIKP